MKILFIVVWRAIIVIARDMLIGFILGIGSTVLLYKINPNVFRVASLLIPVGIIAGVLKGLAKHIFLSVFSAIPSKGYRYNYPKYKLLFLWVTLLLGILIFAFGFHFKLWVSEPLRLIMVNPLLAPLSYDVWVGLLFFISLSGILAYLYEPPINPNESLPEEIDL